MERIARAMAESVDVDWTKLGGPERERVLLMAGAAMDVVDEESA